MKFTFNQLLGRVHAVEVLAQITQTIQIDRCVRITRTVHSIATTDQ